MSSTKPLQHLLEKFHLYCTQELVTLNNDCGWIQLGQTDQSPRTALLSTFIQYKVLILSEIICKQDGFTQNSTSSS